MDAYDPEMAARVWNRVRGNGDEPAKPNTQGLLSLIAEELQDATTYLHLSRQYQGKEGAVLRKMSQEEQSHAACLKGIYTLITGTRPEVRAVPPKQEPVEVTLRRCYGWEMRCLAEYQDRSTDPEYGQVFARLATQEREHCRQILELLGASDIRGMRTKA